MPNKIIAFGNRLRQIREEMGLSQEKFAEKLGTSKQVISRYETNQRTPKITLASEYAEKLGVTLDYMTRNIEREVTFYELRPKTKKCDWCKIDRMTHGIILSDEKELNYGDIVLIMFNYDSITIRLKPGGFTNTFEIKIPIKYCPICQAQTNTFKDREKHTKKECSCLSGKVFKCWDNGLEKIEVSINGSLLQISFQFSGISVNNWIETIHINYCPFCGKKLMSKSDVI